MAMKVLILVVDSFYLDFSHFHILVGNSQQSEAPWVQKADLSKGNTTKERFVFKIIDKVIHYINA
jgi:hypothetical protein